MIGPSRIAVQKQLNKKINILFFAAFVVSLAFIGYLILPSKAATQGLRVEVESLNRDQNASVGGDALASGSQYGLFGSSSSQCGIGDKLVPLCGAWLGGWSNDYGVSGLKNQVANHETRIGRKLDVVRSYHPVGNLPLSSEEKEFINRENTTLFLNWKPSNNWASVASGSVNTDIDKVADSIKSVTPKQVLMTIYHEPEDNVSGGASGCSANFTYKGDSGTPADYRAMWAKVRERFDAKGVSNVVWVMNYMGFTNWHCMENEMWPGNNSVDWVMWDPYGSGKESWDANVDVFYNWLTDNSNTSHDYLSKPWGLAEWGAWHQNQSDVYNFYNGAISALDNNKYPKIKLYSIFDSAPTNDSRISYTWGGTFDQQEENKYKDFANDPLLKQPHTPASTVASGEFSGTIDVSTAGTYKIWARVMVPDANNNSYKLQIDSNQAVTVGDTQIAAGTWAWVDWQDGDTNNKVSVQLSAGSHSIKLIANEPGVKLDQLILTTDTNCTPTDKGDNCVVVQDTQPPAIPTGLQATAGDSQVTLSWNANPEPNIKAYALRYRSGTNDWIWPERTTSTTQTITNLTNGTAYEFQVRAINQDEVKSDYSSSVTATPKKSSKQGDLTNDSKVDIFDLSILLSKWNTGGGNADINSDGTVNVFDLSILLSNWG